MITLPGPPLEFDYVPRPRITLHKVFIVYRQQFSRWFFITAPTSILAALTLFVADQRIHAIFANIPQTELRYHFAEIAEAGVVRYGSFFLSWLLGCFALGAIAAAICERDSDEDTTWHHDSHQRAREHFGALFVVAFLTFCAFLAGISAVLFIGATAFRLIGWSPFSRFNYPIVLAGYTVIAGIVSWFGMAIPLIIRESIGPWSAIRKSLKLSNGYEIFLFLLVIESVVGSYLGWCATHYGLMFLIPASMRFTVWYDWLVYLVSILASAAVQPPMFIGFSMLATEPASVRDKLPADSSDGTFPSQSEFRVS